jgi:hypothetical protein
MTDFPRDFPRLCFRVTKHSTATVSCKLLAKNVFRNCVAYTPVSPLFFSPPAFRFGGNRTRDRQPRWYLHFNRKLRHTFLIPRVTDPRFLFSTDDDPWASLDAHHSFRLLRDGQWNGRMSLNEAGYAGYPYRVIS